MSNFGVHIEKLEFATNSLWRRSLKFIFIKIKLKEDSISSWMAVAVFSVLTLRLKCMGCSFLFLFGCMSVNRI